MRVYVSSNRMSNIYHTDTECNYCGDDMTTKPLSVVEATYEHCEWCAGEVERTPKYDVKTCSACGEDYKQVANHIRQCSEK